MSGLQMVQCLALLSQALGWNQLVSSSNLKKWMLNKSTIMQQTGHKLWVQITSFNSIDAFTQIRCFCFVISWSTTIAKHFHAFKCCHWTHLFKTSAFDSLRNEVDFCFLHCSPMWPKKVKECDVLCVHVFYHGLLMTVIQIEEWLE